MKLSVIDAIFYISALEAAFVVPAFILSWMSSLGCNFVRAEADGQAPWKFGIWRFHDDGTSNSCHRYDHDETHKYDFGSNASMRASRVSSLLSLVFAVAGVLGGLYWVTRKKRTFALGWVAYLLASVSQGLTLLLLDVCRGFYSKNERVACRLSTGAGLSMAAALLWVLASMVNFVGFRAHKRAHVLREAGLEAPLIT